MHRAQEVRTKSTRLCRHGFSKFRSRGKNLPILRYSPGYQWSFHATLWHNPTDPATRRRCLRDLLESLVVWPTFCMTRWTRSLIGEPVLILNLARDVAALLLAEPLDGDASQSHLGVDLGKLTSLMLSLGRHPSSRLLHFGQSLL